MFTGIIEKRSKVAAVAKSAGILRISIQKPSGWKLASGQSINIDGVCSTVVRTDAKNFGVEYMRETLSKTIAEKLQKGSEVNLERSLKFGDYVDGHFVQGHVDARAKVSMIYHTGREHLVEIALARSLRPLAVEHGSIAINGVSLTIARTGGGKITVALIPHTLAHTNLGKLKRGDEVNVETDIFARYGAQRSKNARVMSHAKKTNGKKK